MEGTIPEPIVAALNEDLLAVVPDVLRVTKQRRRAGTNVPVRIAAGVFFGAIDATQSVGLHAPLTMQVSTTAHISCLHSVIASGIPSAIAFESVSEHLPADAPALKRRELPIVTDATKYCVCDSFYDRLGPTMIQCSNDKCTNGVWFLVSFVLHELVLQLCATSCVVL